MTCPKCQGDMRSYERNGVVVDQCGDCRGLFLDRGELERLVDAEGSFYKDTPAAPPPPRHEHQGHGQTHTQGQHQDHSQGYGGYEYRGKHYKKRKKNFLEELFD